jgi:hypothetical protein
VIRRAVAIGQAIGPDAVHYAGTMICWARRRLMPRRNSMAARIYIKKGIPAQFLDYVRCRLHETM